ncbi:unnamed protein product [Zymoseptoria tritici ST99CH_1E4]|uniref:DUF7053 domain-containing protein n=2 Tax=Zymoseptoria tritici TaxID=1047171 RepID=A0A2H1GYS8_ZYMTR|nr:unnamed protein product [Zymoseptoria tritici ST99CH_1E4]
MPKYVKYTKITPLPSNVPRQLAIELLHNHSEVIELNPLVTGVKAIDAPRTASSEEYFSQWYEISEIITWGFGMKKKITFKGVFHDQPWGLQSHVYAPMGVDLRNKYRIGGNQPGEPRETKELGVETPLDGLYLREDVEIVCNVALASFVKKETKEATGKMIERLARKAELLDEGRLHAMFEDGKLKTAKPSGGYLEPLPTVGSPPTSPGRSPSVVSAGFPSPRLDQKGFGNVHDVMRNASQHRVSNTYSPAYQQPNYNGPEDAQAGASQPGRATNMPMINELPGSEPLPSHQSQQGSPSLYPPPLNPQGIVFRSELPGDTTFDPFNLASQPPHQQPTTPPYPVDAKPPLNYNTYTTPPPQHTTTQQHPINPTQSTTVAEWQRGLSNPGVAQPPQSPPIPARNFSRQTRDADRASSAYSDYSSPTTSSQPDHHQQRFSNLTVNSTPPQMHSRTVSSSNMNANPTAPAVVGGMNGGFEAKCPVCEDFVGDEGAVSFHVEKVHFQ